jgi:transposase
VARDRSGAYAEGARRGAPQAEQVRFHLVQNLAAVLETVFTAHVADLRTVEQATLERTWGKPSGLAHRIGRLLSGPKPTSAGSGGWQDTSRLHRDGWSGEAISRHLGIGRSTVVRYLRHETFPERRGRSDAGRSRLDPWKPIILERWNAGCRHSRRLFREIQSRGYRGSYPTLARYTQRLRQAQEGTARRASRERSLPPVADPQQRPLTPRTAAWLGLRHSENLTAAETDQLNRLRTQHAALTEAIILAEAFVAMVRARLSERFDPWLRRRTACCRHSATSPGRSTATTMPCTAP